MTPDSEGTNTDLEDPVRLFVPNDTFLLARGCVQAAVDTSIPAPCSVCPPERCWYLEMRAFRAAGMPALTPRAWRRQVADLPEGIEGGFGGEPMEG